MKIVGVGLNKTGTTTLGECLRTLGYDHISYNYDAFCLYRDGNCDALMEMVNCHDSFEDWPWPLIYKEIDEKFPGSKFILTRRVDSMTWFNSLCKHRERMSFYEYEKHIYGHDWPHDYPEHHIRIYEEHLTSVRNYFRDRPNDFLEVCWETGDGWQELSSFLNIKCPDYPFPHANKRPTTLERVINYPEHLTKRCIALLRKAKSHILKTIAKK